MEKMEMFSLIMSDCQYIYVTGGADFLRNVYVGLAIGSFLVPNSYLGEILSGSATGGLFEAD